MENKTQDFEDFLSDKCDTHTNNDPAGFEKWLEELDGQEYMDYAEEWGNTLLEKIDLLEMQLDEIKNKDKYGK